MALSNGAGTVNDTASPEEFLKSVPVPQIPRSLNVRSVTRELTSYKDASELFAYNVAAHACLLAPCDNATMFGRYRAAVMMHLRFDGTFGFPGGFLNPGEELLTGLTRELKEEANYCITRQRPITPTDYHSTRVVHKDSLVLHFFVVQLTMTQFEALEANALAAKEYGKEVFGTVRVPLYTMDNHFNGLPAFINNRFIGCAKQELLMALFSSDVLTDEQIDQLGHNANNMKLAPNQM